MANRIRALLSVFALVLAAACAAPAGPESRPAVDIARGGDLYRAYCNVCHTAQVHWREKRLVRSWDDLRYQVSRWQKIDGLNWSTDEIDDVAAYLNRVFYDLPCPGVGCGGSATLPIGGRPS
jgi:mono/diheme cytochrome c family protein